MSKTSHAKNGRFIVDTSRLSAGLWNIYVYIYIFYILYMNIYMYNYVYLTIGFIVDTSILSGALPRLYGRYIYTQWCFMVHIYICA